MIGITTKYLSPTNRNRPQIPMSPRYITVHNTANASRGADAEMHARYLANGAGRRSVSWHFTVDDHSIYQHLPTDEVGYHAGDGRGSGNMRSIGIEICENADGDFQKAVRNAQDLIRHLMNKHNIDINHVVPHKHWTGKNCPHLLLNTWGAFKNGLKGSYTPPKTETKPVTVTQSKWVKVNGNWTGQTLKRGQYGEPVKQLQSKLGIKSDGYFGEDTEKAVENVQRGASIAVDGLAGKNTYKALTGANLKVDGYLGKNTIKALQRYFDTPVDGIISKPSVVIKALQKLLRVKADGYLGPVTIRAMQKRFGTPQDGVISKPSVVIKELQRRLNKGRL